MTDDEQEPLVVSEFEWLSLEHALLNGLDHPLDELLEGRRFVVDSRPREACAGHRAKFHLTPDAT